jgi:ATP-binding cassette subfamily G (WHITE) protein 2 (SNQ2)
LTQLSKTRTSKSARSNPPTSGLRRHISRQSRATNNETEPDVEVQGDEKPAEDGGDGDFELGDFLKDGHFEKRQEGRTAKKVGVVYKNLTVKGVVATMTSVKTLPSSIIGVSTA